jgi:hypothetical protein
MIFPHELEAAYLTALVAQIEEPVALTSLRDVDPEVFGGHVIRVALATLRDLIVARGMFLTTRQALSHLERACDGNEEAVCWIRALDIVTGARADLAKLGAQVGRLHAAGEAEAVLATASVHPDTLDEDLAGILGRVTDILGRTSDDRWRVEDLSGALEKYARGEAVIPPEMAESVVVFGHPDLDDPENGIIASRSTLGVIAAPPTWGKSSAVSQITASSAMAGRHVMVASLEQNREQLSMRSIASLMGAFKGQVTRGGHTRYVGHEQREAATRIHMLSPGSGTPWFRIEAAARQLHRQGKLDILIVDYFTLLEPPNIGKQFSSAAMYGWISKSAKRLAQDLKIAVILVAQFNRKMEHIDQEPEPSDLKETGQLEQDADWMWFLWATPKKDGMKPKAHEQNRVSAWKKAKNRWGKVDFFGDPRYLEIDPARDLILPYVQTTDEYVPGSTQKRRL